MNYTVVWNHQPTEAVDAEWETADPHKRDQLIEALESIQVSLASNPYQAGESREHPLERVVFAPALTVYFRIDRATSKVRVYAVVVWRGR